MAVALTTVANVTALLGSGTGSQAGQIEDQVEALIGAVSQAIELHLNRPLLATSRTEYVDSVPGSKALQLQAFPVSAITSVVYEATWDFSDADKIETLTTPEDYWLQADTGVVHLAKTRTAAPRAYKVVYTGGMIADTAAALANYPDLVDACEKQVTYEWRRRANLDGASHQMQGSATTYTAAVKLLPSVIERLSTYRRQIWIV